MNNTDSIGSWPILFIQLDFVYCTAAALPIHTSSREVMLTLTCVRFRCQDPLPNDASSARFTLYYSMTYEVREGPFKMRFKCDSVCFGMVYVYH